MNNPDLYAQYDRDCLAATAQADADEERLETASDDEFNETYRAHLEKRRDWNRYLAAEAARSRDYFGGDGQ